MVAVVRRDVTGRDDRIAAVKSRRESIVVGQKTALDNASFRELYISCLPENRRRVDVRSSLRIVERQR
jgi:hypothetical protein